MAKSLAQFAQEGEDARRRAEEAAIAAGLDYRLAWSWGPMHFAPLYYLTHKDAKVARKKEFASLKLAYTVRGFERATMAPLGFEMKLLSFHLEKRRDGIWRKLVDSEREASIAVRSSRSRRRKR